MRTSLQLSAQGFVLLKALEESRLSPYDDQTGKEVTDWCKGATIGYGHLIPRQEWHRYKNGIDAATAAHLFLFDLIPYLRAVPRTINRPLAQHQFDALVIFAFNIGTSHFSSSAAVKLINDPSAKTNYKDLESAWKAWNKSQGVLMAGLINRRAVEWRVYSQGIYQA